MIHVLFAHKVRDVILTDEAITGLAAAGSWITNELDEYSDLDLIIVTKEKIGGNKAAMMAYANKFGKLLSAFTGEHVGEIRLLICLYDDPLLHVDLKFVTLEEFKDRVENPFIILDKEGFLHQAIEQTEAVFPYPDLQWIEDRFWIWVHYALLKIGRGENLEAMDFLAYLRMVVLGPLLHIKNGNLPKGVRRAETQLPAPDLQKLQATISINNKTSLIKALEEAIGLYQELRLILHTPEVTYNLAIEEKVIAYLQYIKHKN